MAEQFVSCSWISWWAYESSGMSGMPVHRISHESLEQRGQERTLVTFTSFHSSVCSFCSFCSFQRPACNWAGRERSAQVDTNSHRSLARIHINRERAGEEDRERVESREMHCNLLDKGHLMLSRGVLSTTRTWVTVYPRWSTWTNHCVHSGQGKVCYNYCCDHSQGLEEGQNRSRKDSFQVQSDSHKVSCCRCCCCRCCRSCTIVFSPF